MFISYNPPYNVCTVDFFVMLQYARYAVNFPLFGKKIQFCNVRNNVLIKLNQSENFIKNKKFLQIKLFQHL